MTKLIKFENAIDEHGNGKGTDSVLKSSLVSELLQSVCSVLFNISMITLQVIMVLCCYSQLLACTCLLLAALGGCQSRPGPSRSQAVKTHQGLQIRTLASDQNCAVSTKN